MALRFKHQAQGIVCLVNSQIISAWKGLGCPKPINDLTSVSPSRTSICERIIRKSLFDSGIVVPTHAYSGAITESVWLICF